MAVVKFSPDGRLVNDNATMPLLYSTQYDLGPNDPRFGCGLAGMWGVCDGERL